MNGTLLFLFLCILLSESHLKILIAELADDTAIAVFVLYSDGW